MQILTQVSNEMSFFLTFHEKVYLILTNLGEKLEFRTISEKSDRNPSTVLLNNNWKLGRMTITINWNWDYLVFFLADMYESHLQMGGTRRISQNKDTNET